MFRKDLIPLLSAQALTVTEIARFADQPGRDTVEDLEHLLLSLRHTALRAEVEPAVCRKCGFTFGQEKLRKPSKCPECKSTWVTEPRIRLVGKANDAPAAHPPSSEE